ncbi:RDD family protein [Pseudonocardia sp. H11422]|uniref:RDD family protein n=1 Tax=Pseudonocardia sp. H11422 TaxID=2835866 RepID=UPI001BDC10EA|nr:RDD family protein [Pseudonocardia sp. H11422]
MARWIDSWLPGSPVGPSGGATSGYPGEQFGLPRDGVGAAAGFWRRFAAIAIDWLLARLIALLFSGQEVYDGFTSPESPWTILAVWFVLTAVSTAIFGATPGMTVLGIRVASIDSAAVIGVPRALLRTFLLALVVPPLVRDADGRGWHDRVARTIVIRTR